MQFDDLCDVLGILETDAKDIIRIAKIDIPEPNQDRKIICNDVMYNKLTRFVIESKIEMKQLKRAIHAELERLIDYRKISTYDTEINDSMFFIDVEIEDEETDNKETYKFYWDIGLLREAGKNSGKWNYYDEKFLELGAKYNKLCGYFY